MDKKPQHRPKLVIVNLQWTPKDDFAVLKINGTFNMLMVLQIEREGQNLVNLKIHVNFVKKK